MSEFKKFIVLGGAGAMGSITVRDLIETGHPHDEVVIADFDYPKAKALAANYMSHERHNGPHVSALHVNARDIPATAKALQGAFVVINCAQYQLNVEVMQAALQARCHYVDLGGLFHVTKRQLELDAEFKKIGKLAILGMGAAPGITNILARHAADTMDTVSEIHTRVGSVDQTKYDYTPALPVSYSLKTILEEFSYEPAVFTKGKMTFVKPMSGDTPHAFPKPIGVQKPMFTIHSEVQTLPTSYLHKGVREVSFKIAFSSEFLSRVRFLRDLGMASHEDLNIGGVRVKPIDVVNKVAMSQMPAKAKSKLKQYEVVRAVVKGTLKKKKVTWIVDCHTSGMPEWGIGLDIDTGSPPAIAAQMLARGEIRGSGTLAPELCVPPEPFFKHLARRKMKIQVQKKSGWAFKV